MLRCVTFLQRLQPRLYQTHPGYALVLIALMVLHLSLGLDHILGGEARHSVGVWTVASKTVPAAAWGVLHLFTWVLQVAGLFGGRFLLVRVACNFGGSVLFAEASLFLYGVAANPEASYTPTVALAALAAISWRAAVEPELPGAAKAALEAVAANVATLEHPDVE